MGIVEHKCDICHGTGKEVISGSDYYRFMDSYDPDGGADTGKKIEIPCRKCNEVVKLF